MAAQAAPAGMSLTEARRFLRCFPEVARGMSGWRGVGGAEAGEIFVFFCFLVGEVVQRNDS